MPGMTRDELYRNTAGWHSVSLNLSFGGVVCKDEDKGYRARYYNQRFGNKQWALFGTVSLTFRDGSFDLTFTDISAFYGNKDVDPVSTCDDRFNRTWYWRVTRSQKVIDEIRKRSKEIFEMITASMDEYLKVGPPVELKKLWQSRRPRQPPQGGCLCAKQDTERCENQRKVLIIGQKVVQLFFLYFICIYKNIIIIFAQIDEIHIDEGAMSSYIQQLEEYFNKTTLEQQDKDYQELQKFNKNGITVDDYIRDLGIIL